MDIGSRIREFRNLKGLTQQELADRAELTKGFISQLERNQNSPSISTLIDILQCLGTTPAEFFNDSHPEQVVFKKEDYFEKYNAELKNNIEWLIPNAQRNAMEPIRLCLEPGGFPSRISRMKVRNSVLFLKVPSKSVLAAKLTQHQKVKHSITPLTERIIFITAVKEKLLLSGYLPRLLSDIEGECICQGN